MGDQAVTYRIVFDGGSLGNPGRGYGSFRLRHAGEPWSEPVRCEFGDAVTNNEAEYRSLIAALEALLDLCDDPAAVSVEASTDSMLVVKQMQGAWKVRAANLAPLRTAAQRLAGNFAKVRFYWHPRQESVTLLGH